MKNNILILAIIFFLFTNLSAQEEYKTIFSENNVYGGYGGINIGYSRLNKKDAMLLGGRGAVLINHYLGIGGAAYAFFNEASINTKLDYGKKYRLKGGYGGILIEPIVKPQSPVHISFPLLIGAGSVAYTADFIDNWHSDKDENMRIAKESFFIIAQGMELEFNLLKQLRLALCIYYRHTSDINLITESPDIIPENKQIQLAPNNVLRGILYSISIKTGKF